MLKLDFHIFKLLITNTLKKLLLVLSLFLLIYACSKDDSSDSNSIEGRWNRESVTIDGKNFEYSPCHLKLHYIFNNGKGDVYVYQDEMDTNGDGKWTPVPCYQSEVIAFSYSAIPDRPNHYIFVNTSEEENTSQDKIEVSGNKLTWSYEGSINSYETGEPISGMIIETFTRD